MTDGGTNGGGGGGAGIPPIAAAGSPDAGGAPAASPWWFLVVVVAAGAMSFAAVWAFFRYRAERAAAVPTTLPAAVVPDKSGVPPLPDLGAVLPPLPDGAARSRADVARCAGNLRRVAAALQAWANRHDWRLPGRLEQLVEAGLLDAAALACPAAGPPPPADLAAALGAPVASTYVYVGQGLRTPAGFDTVVLYEPPRHFAGTGMNVLFGDGSVRVLAGADADRLQALVATGRRPVVFPPASVPEGGSHRGDAEGPEKSQSDLPTNEHE